jgi:hypothetical protein
MIFEQGNRPESNKFSFAWNCRECSRLPLVSVDESLQLRISEFVKKLINSDKEGAF